AAAVSQPSSVSANVRETVRITCTGGSYCSYSSYDSYGIYYAWVQQKVPGSGPVTLIYLNDKRPSYIPSQFSGSISGTMSMVTISGVQAEGKAVYFCGGWDSSS
ncbi:LV1 protein, partial [Acrocephalus arundinaceus]|nr:LV1 protein [Acrocephalus arundinaceus]